MSQARILERAAISLSRISSRPRDRTHVSCIGRQILYHWATGKPTLQLLGTSYFAICPWDGGKNTGWQSLDLGSSFYLALADHIILDDSLLFHRFNFLPWYDEMITKASSGSEFSEKWKAEAEWMSESLGELLSPVHTHSVECLLESLLSPLLQSTLRVV